MRRLSHGIFGIVFATLLAAPALVLVAATVLQCDLVQWCLLIACIGGVLTTELFNSAVETLCRELDPEVKERSWQSLDISAGAVLLASFTAVAIGTVVRHEELLALLDRTRVVLARIGKSPKRMLGWETRLNVVRMRHQFRRASR